MFNLFGSKDQPLHAAKIEDYALIGDCETAALVSRNGSIDWLCWPTFSSGACFAALLGTWEHGYWQISPTAKDFIATRDYVGDSLIVETLFETKTGAVKLIDFMPPRGGYSDVIRILKGVRGKVTLTLSLSLRFDYGLTIPWVTHTPDGLRAISGMHMVLLRAHGRTIELTPKEHCHTAEFTLAEGEELAFTLTYASALGDDSSKPATDPPAFKPGDAYQDTLAFWSQWNSRNTYKGDYADVVQRSLMVLKALTYRPSGGIVAAPTACLPEKIGGMRNWDYRYCWLRDTAFTLLALLKAGYEEEAEAWRRWLLRAIAGDPAQLQTIYGICGERHLPEWKAEWLPGYENSTPISLGNGAVTQFQLDVFGEVISALARMPEADDDIKVSASALQANLVDHLCKIWDQPDDGIWETRGGRQHFTHSKVMAWVALDRAIRNYEKFGGDAGAKGDIKKWIKNRDLIHKQVCEKGFNKKLNAFTQFYGSDHLDASCLRIGMVGFLPMDDPRIIGTVEAIKQHLTRDGFVLRYDTKASPDGLPPGEGVFLACSFWMVINLHLIGRTQEAKAMFERLIALQNDIGLLSEEWDPEQNRMLGNFPQALSHIAMAHAAYTLSGTFKPDRG